MTELLVGLGALSVILSALNIAAGDLIDASTFAAWALVHVLCANIWEDVE